MTHHPAVAEVLAHFEFEHLPPELRAFSRPCHRLAHQMADRLSGAELTWGLRQLLLAKDAFVRAAKAADPIPAAVPQLGDVLLALVDPKRNNGDDTAPAIVTRVWSPTLVNVRILLDGNDIEWKTSATVADTREDAEGKHAVFRRS